MTTTTTYIPAALDEEWIVYEEDGTTDEALCEICGDAEDYCTMAGTCEMNEYAD